MPYRLKPQIIMKRNQLMTQEIARKLAKYPLYSQDGLGREAVVVTKYFLPSSAWTWYVLEAEKEYSDYRFFGIVINNYQEAEYGYFMLGDLESVSVPLKVRIAGGEERTIGTMGIERDVYWQPTKVGDITAITELLDI